MKNLLSILFVFFVFNFCVQAQTQTGNFYLISVGDTNSSDLSSTIVNDMKHTVSEFSLIAANLRQKLKNHDLKGNKVNIKDINDTINELKLTKDDIVVFYYSGHGKIISNDKGVDERYMTFSNDEKYRIKDLIALIGDKAIFKLCIFDCCSDKQPFMPDNSSVGQKRSSLTLDDDLTKYNLRNLFLKSSYDSVNIYSCKKGYNAYCNIEGSFFSESFFKALGNELKGSSTSWGKLEEETTEILNNKAKLRNTLQKPLFEKCSI